jgi:hypothetical protein
MEKRSITFPLINEAKALSFLYSSSVFSANHDKISELIFALETESKVSKSEFNRFV